MHWLRAADAAVHHRAASEGGAAGGEGEREGGGGGASGGTASLATEIKKLKEEAASRAPRTSRHPRDTSAILIRLMLRAVKIAYGCDSVAYVAAAMMSWKELKEVGRSDEAKEVQEEVLGLQRTCEGNESEEYVRAL